MTLCNLLREKTMKNGDTITAWENWEKYIKTPRYEITVSRDGIAYQVIPVAKTTWNRKFKELSREA